MSARQIFTNWFSSLPEERQKALMEDRALLVAESRELGRRAAKETFRRGLAENGLVLPTKHLDQ